MNVMVSISCGELFDKIEILKIKEQKISDREKLKHVKYELNILLGIGSKIPATPRLTDLALRLGEINSKLWDVEDNIRLCERNKLFDDEFVRLARSVYHYNDERFRLKNAINIECSSEVHEMKSYQEY